MLMRGGPALGFVPGSRAIFAPTRESVTRRCKLIFGFNIDIDEILKL
jgi:hypothetical protein